MLKFISHHNLKFYQQKFCYSSLASKCYNILIENKFDNKVSQIKELKNIYPEIIKNPVNLL